MIDSKIKERIIVLISEKYGPYIRLSKLDDAGALEDALDDLYHVLYWKVIPESAQTGGRSEYYFGNASDPVKLQAILEEIAF